MKISTSLVQRDTPSSVALGMFDGLHIAHAAVFSAVMSNIGDMTPVALTFDVNPKGSKKLLTKSAKLKIFEQFGAEELIELPFNEIKSLSPEDFVNIILAKKLKAKRVCCGFNYTFGKDKSGDAQTLRVLCEKQGIEVIVCEPVLDGETVISSTGIRDFLAQGDVKSAAKYLGRPFGYDYVVVHGQQRGRLMGTPTLNQHFPDDFFVPKFGVYASAVRYKGASYAGVTNIGVRPTVGSDFPLSETWIPDFSGDLYGETVEVFLLEYLRGEKKFSNMDMLRDAIKKDGERARSLFPLFEKSEQKL